MTRYLVSFPSGAMDHIPDEDEPEVARAAHAVIDEAKDAGVYLFAGGLDEDVEPVMVAGDGTVVTGTYPARPRQTIRSRSGTPLFVAALEE